MKKKILGLILSMSMLLSLSVPTVSQAALGISHELEVSLMAALGIVPGYPDNYNADAAVSQSDFTKYAYAAVGVEISDPEGFAKSYGMGGAEDITLAQAEQVVLKATEYEYMMGPEDAASFSRSIGLLNGLRSNENDYKLTAQDAAVMLYNAVNLKVIEHEGSIYKYGDTEIIEEKLKVYEEKGIVTANGSTSLSGYGSTADNEVRIDDEVYNVGNTSAKDMLGRAVKFYYQESRGGEDVIKWIEINDAKNTTAIIYGCDVSSASGDTIKYYASSGTRKSVSIARGADMIYNGVRTDALTIDAVGSLTSVTTLISNDGSNKYNVVIIEDYDYYLVDSYTASNKTVNDFESNQTLDVDEDHYSSFAIYKDGFAVSVSAIETGQVLAAAVSEDGFTVKIEIITGSVTGEITSLDSDSVAIGGTSYDISPAYAGDQLKIGRSGTFYFDKAGNIVRCVASKAQASKYGYLMNYYSNTDGTGDFKAKLLTADGAMNVFDVRDSLSYNGFKKDAGEVYQLLDAKNGCDQLINYKLNNENEITEIKTADERYVGVDEDNIDSFTMHYKGSGRYRKNNMCFNSKYLIDSTTPIFFIPYDGDRDDYTVKYASYLTNGWTYDIAVYDIDEYMYASAVVLKENLIEPENLRNKRPMVVTRVMQGVDEDNEDAIYVEGYRQGSKASFMLYNKDMYDNRGTVQARYLSEGDVIQFGQDADGKINVVQLLYSARSDKLNIAGGTDTPNKYWEGGTVTFPDLWVTCGRVVNRSSDVILVDDDGDDSILSKTPHLLGTAITYLYEEGKVSVSNKNEIAIGDTVYVHEYQGKVQDILIVRE